MAENTFITNNTPKESANSAPAPKVSAQKQKATPESKKKKTKLKRPTFHKDKRFQLSSGIFLMLGAAFATLAMISFIFTGHADQSIMESFLATGVRAAGVEAANWLGITGAWVSYIFMYRLTGVASFTIPVLIFLWGAKITFDKVTIDLRRIRNFIIFFNLWLATFMSLCLLMSESRTYHGYWSFLGGGIGHEIALLFDELFGWGAFIILLIIVGTFIIYFFDIKESLRLPQFSAPDFLKRKHSEDTDATDQEEELTEEAPIPPVSAQEELQPKNNKPAAPAPKKVALTIEKTPPEPQQETEEEPLPFEVPEVVLKPQSMRNKVLVPEEEALIPNEDSATPESENDASEAQEIPLPLPKKKQEITAEEEENLELSVEVAEVDDKAEEDEDEATNVLNSEPYDPHLDLGSYEFPSAELLTAYPPNDQEISEEELQENSDKIVETLQNFRINIDSIKATIGPTVTLYEIVPARGVKISKIKNLEDDIALSLSALGIRIIAPIPGKGTVGIEVPNTVKEMVSMRSVLDTDKFQKSNKILPVVIGKTISNEVFVFDLAKMPHLLIAGATGQGKSVGLNAVLTSLLYKKHPSELKFILVDPKKVELTLYNKIEKHFLAKLPDEDEAIITDTKKVVNTLNSLCIEMDSRYDLLKNAGCRNIKEYNAKFVSRKLNPLDGHRFLPYIVLVIDELADLMMTAGKEVETPIARLAQLARAIGIHLVVATQRPSVNVITGIIKANFPARLSFKVTSKIDSRTILDAGGAEQLIGRGDMLLSQGSDLIRLQCAFVDTPEVDRVCDFISEQRSYSTAYLLPEYVGEEGENGAAGVDLSERDVLFEEAAYTVIRHQSGSTSLIQRKLKLGYNRAGRIIDQLEAAGIVGPAQGSKARELLVNDEYALEQLLDNM